LSKKVTSLWTLNMIYRVSWIFKWKKINVFSLHHININNQRPLQIFIVFPSKRVIPDNFFFYASNCVLVLLNVREYRKISLLSFLKILTYLHNMHIFYFILLKITIFFKNSLGSLSKILCKYFLLKIVGTDSTCLIIRRIFCIEILLL